MVFDYRMPALREFLAMSLITLVGGGCVAIYGFDDFEKNSPIACVTATDCPGSDSCGQRECNGGICQSTDLVAAGVLTTRNERGNCLRFVCDGLGNEVIEIDATNFYVDGDPCTEDFCVEDIPVNQLAPAGTQCGPNANVICTEQGACSGCTTPADCGENTACLDWACVDSICVRNLQPVGKEVANDVPGDCKKKLCNAAGEFPNTFASNDAPDDKDPCTADYCAPNGEILHDALPEGTKCDECKVCAKDGTCQACDAATSDCYKGTCVPKPKECPNGAADCPNSYCVDGFCCNSPCSGQCMACSEGKTGQQSGICAPITNDTDPDNECENMTGDVCWDGNCRCANQKQDGLETGTDCGGNCLPCTGKWDCGGVEACNGNAPDQCCWIDAGRCNNCTNEKQSCLSLQGSTCIIGTPAQLVTLGVVWNWGCLGNTCRYVNCACK